MTLFAPFILRSILIGNRGSIKRRNNMTHTIFIDVITDCRHLTYESNDLTTNTIIVRSQHKINYLLFVHDSYLIDIHIMNKCSGFWCISEHSNTTILLHGTFEVCKSVLLQCIANYGYIHFWMLSIKYTINKLNIPFNWTMMNNKQCWIWLV